MRPGIFLRDEPLVTGTGHVATADAFRRELIALIPRLRQFARVLTGNTADADDVVQACLERAMRNMHQWQQGTRLDRWAMTIARNAWVDNRRLARNRSPHDDLTDHVELAGDDGESIVMQRDRDRRVRAAVDSLPDDQRTLVGLVVLEGYSYREAADMLEIPIGTVMSRLSRAKAALAERLAGGGLS
jgi:RNA polymerase sigma-70 factor, ECF subfamily